MAPSDSEGGMLSIETTELKAGFDNRGIFRHDVRLAGRQNTFSLFEKRLPRKARYRNEFRLSRAIQERGEAGQSIWPLPRVIATARTDVDYIILTEHYKGIDARLDNLEEQLLHIADALVALNRMPLDLAARRGIAADRLDFRDEAMISAQHREIAWHVDKLFHKVKQVLPDNVYVACHNDAHFGNIATTKRNNAINVRLIDLGLVALNGVGADLHCFFKMEARGEIPRAGLERMVDHYARGMGVTADVVALNAHLQALVSAVRAIPHHHTHGRKRIVASQFKSAEILLQTIEPLLSGFKGVQPHRQRPSRIAALTSRLLRRAPSRNTKPRAGYGSD